MTLIQEINWLSYYHAFIYINKYREATNSVLGDVSIQVEERPTMDAISKEWDMMLVAPVPTPEKVGRNCPSSRSRMIT